MEWLMSLWHKSHSLSEPIKKYDRVVDGRSDARRQLERTNPALVAARDQAVVELKREKIANEVAHRNSQNHTLRL